MTTADGKPGPPTTSDASVQNIVHTPGPWQVAGGYYLLGSDGVQIATLAKDDDFPEQEANTRLLAAVPELLEMVEELAYGGFDPIPDPRIGYQEVQVSCGSVEKAQALLKRLEVL